MSSYPSISDVQLTKVSSGVLITGKLEDNSEFSSKLESININSNNGNNTLNVTTNNGTFNVLSFGENKEFNVEQISKLEKEVSTLVSESKELKQIFINNGNMYAKFNDEYLCINKPSMGALEKLDGKTTSIQVTASQYNEIVDAVFDGNTKFKIVSEKENEGKLILYQINDSSLISGNHKISLNIVGIEEKEEPNSSSSVAKGPEPDSPNSPEEIKETIVGCEL